MKNRFTALFLSVVLPVVCLGSLSCAKFDGNSQLLLILLLQQSTSETPWWTEGSNYTYRRKIKFGTSHSALIQYYTASISMDTTADQGVALTSGNDVRIIHQTSDGTATELDRVGANWNTTSTTIEFRLIGSVALNTDQPDSGAYYVYYGDASAGTPQADESDVYYYMDRFTRSDGSVGNNWTTWDDGATGEPAIVSNQMEIKPIADNANTMGAKTTLALGAIPGDFTLTLDWNMAANNEGTWIFQLVLGDSTSIDNTDRTIGVGPGMYYCETTTLGCAANATSVNNGTGTQIESGVSGSQSFQLDVNRTAYTYTYNRGSGTTVVNDVAFVNNIDTIDQIKISSDNFGDAGGEEQFMDNIKVILKVDSTPVLSLDTVETQ